MNLCREALKQGGLYPASVNSANETANRLFREGKIKFLQIGELVEKALTFAPSYDRYTLDDVYNINEWAEEFILSQI